jgi:hypothetical protein
MAITLRTFGPTVAEANNAAVTADLGTNASIQAGDLALIFASMRSTGSGRSLAAAGYASANDTTGVSNNNITYLLAKAAGAAEADPTVTPTNGINFEFVDAVGAVLAGASGTLHGTPQPQSNAASQTAIAYPAHPITQDGCAVFIEVSYANTATALSTPANFTKLAERLGSANNMTVAWYLWIQTTATSIAAGSITITSGGASAANKATVTVFAPLTNPPAFDVAPSVSATSATTYTQSYTAHNASTFCTAGVLAGGATPSVAQLIAGAGGGILFAANEAVSGADSTVLTISGTVFPIYKICSLLTNADGNTAIAVLADQMHAAPSGKQYVTVATLPWPGGTYSILEGMSPAAVAGDVMVVPLVDNQGDAITLNADGTYSIATADSTYRYFDFNVYDYSAGAYASVADVREHINKSLPVLNTNIANVSVTALTDITPFTVDASDPDGLALTYSKSPASPDPWPATSAVNSSTGQVTYTGVAAGVLSLSVRITGIDGRFIDSNVFTITGIGNVTVPNVLGSNVVNAIDALTTLGFVVATITVIDDSHDNGEVIDQAPAGEATAPQGSTVTLTIAVGNVIDRRRIAWIGSRASRGGRRINYAP